MEGWRQDTLTSAHNNLRNTDSINDQACFPSIFAHPVQDVSQLGQSINEVGAGWADTRTLPVQGGRDHVQHHRPLQHLADKRVLEGIVRVCLDLSLDLGAIPGSLGHAWSNCPVLLARPIGPSFFLTTRAKTYPVSKIGHKNYAFGDTQVHQRLVGRDELVERVQGNSKRINDVARPRWAGHCLRGRCAGNTRESKMT